MSESSPPGRGPALRALAMSTFAFAMCFAAWVVNAVLVTHLVSSGTFRFSGSQVGWLLAVPILTGAVTRVPLGILTDRHGGRRVFTILLLVTAGPMFCLSLARGYGHFLLASLGFGLAGGSFAVGVGYVSTFFERERQGTALGVFGVGNAGAAATTILAPIVLARLVEGDPEGWRRLPQIYAGLLVATAVLFFFSTTERVVASRPRTLAQRLAPLKEVVVWRFGLYYFLVFGGFVSLAQWIIPYSVNVYEVSVARAGLLAAVFSLPSGVIRAAGGWLSDRFGARSTMTLVFWSCLLLCLALAVPKMDIDSPGRGVSAGGAGVVEAVGATSVTVASVDYALVGPPERTPAELDDGGLFLPRVTRWHEPAVAVGDEVEKKGLLARGVTNIYYPANIWVFAVLAALFGVATGIGKAGVYKFIPDQFPDQVGTVGGMVGLLGALGGFFFPPVFGYVLEWSGLWSSCWLVLFGVSLVCLVWMNRTVRHLLVQEVPDLSELIEESPHVSLTETLGAEAVEREHVDELVREIPFFGHLTPEQEKALARIGRTKRLAAGETVFRQGDAGNALYIVVDGRVRIVRSDAAGERELATVGKGGAFGELALIDGKPRAATATVVDDARFFLIERADYLRLLSSSPRMLAEVLVGLVDYVRRNMERSTGADRSR